MQKKKIFPGPGLGIESLTPSYTRIKCQLTETLQETSNYFLTQNLSQNSNFLKNFKSKHLNSAAPAVNSFMEQPETKIQPFKVGETQENESPDTFTRLMTRNNEILMKEVNGTKTSVDNLGMFKPNKKTPCFPVGESLSPSKLKFVSKADKENKGLSAKLKITTRKHSETMEGAVKNEKEEFSASKNLLHSSRVNRSIAAKKEEETTPEIIQTVEDKKIRGLELELANEKIKVAEFQQRNDELSFEIKSLANEIERLQALLNDKDRHFNDLILVKEEYKSKLQGSIEYTDFLKDANRKLLEQLNTVIRTKLLSKT